MTINNENLDKLIFYGTTFTICGGGFWVKNNHLSNFGYFVKNADLAQVHPRLSGAIRLLSRMSPPNECFASSSDILLMLQLWQAEIHMVDADGKQVAAFEVRQITIDDDKVYLQLRGLRYMAITSPYTADPYLIPDQVCRNIVLISAWLDENYPAWRSRFAVATELGCNTHDSVRAMFNLYTLAPSQVLPVDLIS